MRKRGCCLARSVGIVLCAGLCFTLCPRAQASSEVGGLPEGTHAPEFTLHDVSGKTVALESYRGKRVLLNFWAFWCDTWKAEMPELRAANSARPDALVFRDAIGSPFASLPSQICTLLSGAGLPSG